MTMGMRMLLTPEKLLWGLALEGEQSLVVGIGAAVISTLHDARRPCKSDDGQQDWRSEVAGTGADPVPCSCSE